MDYSSGKPNANHVTCCRRKWFCRDYTRNELGAFSAQWILHSGKLVWLVSLRMSVRQRAKAYEGEADVKRVQVWTGAFIFDCWRGVLLHSGILWFPPPLLPAIDFTSACELNDQLAVFDWDSSMFRVEACVYRVQTISISALARPLYIIVPSFSVFIAFLWYHGFFSDRFQHLSDTCEKEKQRQPR